MKIAWMIVSSNLWNIIFGRKMQPPRSIQLICNLLKYMIYRESSLIFRVRRRLVIRVRLILIIGVGLGIRAPLSVVSRLSWLPDVPGLHCDDLSVRRRGRNRSFVDLASLPAPSAKVNHQEDEPDEEKNTDDDTYDGPSCHGCIIVIVIAARTTTGTVPIVITAVVSATVATAAHFADFKFYIYPIVYCLYIHAFRRGHFFGYFFWNTNASSYLPYINS